VGVLLYFKRFVCEKDQYLKAMKVAPKILKQIDKEARENERLHDDEQRQMGAKVNKGMFVRKEIQYAEVYAFRKMWHRLYHYYKPEYFFWILLVLLRKFMIAVTALMFRGNTLFMLSMTLLIVITMFSLQIIFKPYMSTKEYSAVMEGKNAQIVKEQSITKRIEAQIAMDNVSNRSKKTKLGEAGGAEKEDDEVEQLHDYNTVEAVLLFSAVIVNLSGIMFESGQLTGGYKTGMTYFIILLIVGSISYFLFVLSSELWAAFHKKGVPLFYLGCLKVSNSGNAEEEKVDDIRESSIEYGLNPMQGSGGGGGGGAVDMEKMDYMEKEMNKMWGNVAEKDKLIKAQQDEIRLLKKGGEANKMQSMAKIVMAANKKKKTFGSVHEGMNKGAAAGRGMGGSGRGLGSSGRGLGGLANAKKIAKAESGKLAADDDMAKGGVDDSQL